MQDVRRAMADGEHASHGGETGTDHGAGEIVGGIVGGFDGRGGWYGCAGAGAERTSVMDMLEFRGWCEANRRGIL